MGRRIYSDAFVDRRIAKIDEMFERNQKNILMTPDCMRVKEPMGLYGRSYGLSQREIDEVKAYYGQFQELTYVRGFWMGWTVREGARDERDTLIEALMEVARVAYNVPEFDHIFDNYPKQFSNTLKKKLEKLKELGVDLATQPTK